MESVLQNGTIDDLSDKISNHLIYANLLSDFSELSKQTGDLIQGIPLQLKALQLRQLYSQNGVSIGDSLIILGELYSEANDLNNAKVNVIKAESLLEEFYSSYEDTAAVAECTHPRVGRLTTLKEKLTQMERDLEVIQSPVINSNSNGSTLEPSEPLDAEVSSSEEMFDLKQLENISSKLLNLEKVYGIHDSSAALTSNEFESTLCNRIDTLISLATQSHENFQRSIETSERAHDTLALSLVESQRKIQELESLLHSSKAVVPSTMKPMETDDQMQLGQVSREFISKLYLEVTCRTIADKLSIQQLTDDSIHQLSQDLSISRSEVIQLESMISSLNDQVTSLNDFQSSQQLREEEILQFNRSLIKRLEAEIRHLQRDLDGAENEMALFENDRERLCEEIRDCNEALEMSQHSTQFFSQLFLNLAIMKLPLPPLTTPAPATVAPAAAPAAPAQVEEADDLSETVGDEDDVMSSYLTLQTLHKLQRHLEERISEVQSLQRNLKELEEERFTTVSRLESDKTTLELNLENLERALEHSNEINSQKVVELTSDKETLLSRVAELESLRTADLALMEQHSTQLSSELEATRSDLRDSQLRAAEYVTSLEASSDRISQLEELRSQLQLSLAESEQVKDRLTAAISRVAELESLRTADLALMEQHSTELEATRTELRDSQLRAAEYVTSLEASSDRISQLEEQHSQLQLSLGESEQVKDQSTSEYDALIYSYLFEISRLRRNLVEQEGESSAAISRVAELESLRTADLALMEQHSTQLSSELEATRSLLKDSQLRAAEYVTSLEASSDRISQLEEQHSQLQLSLGESEQVKDRLTSQIAELESLRLADLALMKQHSTELEATRSELKDSQLRAAEYVTSLEASSDRISQLKEEIELLGETKEQLRKEAEISNIETSKALRKFAHVLDSVQEEKDQLRKETEVKLSQLDSQLCAMESSNQELVSQLNESLETRVNLENKVQTLENSLIDFTVASTSLTKELDLLREEKAEQEEEIFELEHQLNLVKPQLTKLHRDLVAAIQTSEEKDCAHHHKMAHLTSLLDNSQNEVKQFIDSIAELKETKISLEKDLQDTTAELGMLSLTIQQMTSQHHASIEELDSHVNELEDEIITMKSTHFCYQRKAEEKIDCLTESLSSSTTLSVSTIAELNELKKQYSVTSTECVKLLQELESQRLQQEAQQMSFKTLEDNFTQLSCDHHNLKIEMAAALDFAYGMEMLQVGKSLLPSESDLKKSLEVTTEELSVVTEELSVVKEELSMIQQTSIEMKAHLQLSNEKNRVLELQLNEFEKEMSILRDELEYAEVDSPEIFPLKQENLRLQRKLESSQEMSEILTMERDQLMKQIKEQLDLIRELERSHVASAVLEDQIMRLREKNSELITERERAAHEIHELQKLEDQTEKSIFETWCLVYNSESQYLQSVSSEINDLPDIIELPDCDTAAASPRYERARCYLEEIPKLIKSIETHHSFQIQQLQDKLQTEHHVVSSLSDEKIELRKELKALLEKQEEERVYENERNQQLHVTMASLRREMDELTDSAKKFSMEVEMKTTALEEMSENLKMSEHNNDRLVSENLKLLESLRELRGLYEGMSVELDEAKGREMKLESELSSFEKRNEELIAKMISYDEEKLRHQQELEQLTISENEIKKQLQRLQEQRKLSDPWGFCREMSMGYRRFHQTTSHNNEYNNSSNSHSNSHSNSISSPSSYHHRPTSHDSTESATGAGYRGAKTLKSTTNVLAFSDDEDEGKGTHDRDSSSSSSHLLSTHANELVMGSMPSKNFVAVKSSNLSSDYRSSSPLSSYFSANSSLSRPHTSDVLHFDDYEDHEHDDDEEEEDEEDDLLHMKPVRKSSSKFPSPTKPKISAAGEDLEKLFCPRDPNKKPTAAAALTEAELEENHAFRRIQTADGNLSRRSRLQQQAQGKGQGQQDSSKPNRSSANSSSTSSLTSLLINDPPHRFRSSVSPTSISEKISPLSTSRGGVVTSTGTGTGNQQSSSPVTRTSKIPKKIKTTAVATATATSAGAGSKVSPRKSVDTVEDFEPFSRPGSPQDASALKPKKSISGPSSSSLSSHKIQDKKSLAHRQHPHPGPIGVTSKRVNII
jgi:chromosome segregation ATPase